METVRELRAAGTTTTPEHVPKYFLRAATRRTPAPCRHLREDWGAGGATPIHVRARPRHPGSVTPCRACAGNGSARWPSRARPATSWDTRSLHWIRTIFAPARQSFFARAGPVSIRTRNRARAGPRTSSHGIYTIRCARPPRGLTTTSTRRTCASTCCRRRGAPALGHALRRNCSGD